MAVYTDVSDEELGAFIDRFNIGTLLSYKGIAEGVENSNYLVHTETGYYILTLYEKRVNPDDLPFFLGLMQHLAGKGLNCPTPLIDRDGRCWVSWQDVLLPWSHSLMVCGYASRSWCIALSWAKAWRGCIWLALILRSSVRTP